MTRPSKVWRVAAALFVLINVAGVGYAVAVGEPVHAAVHVALLLGAYLGWRLGPWARRQSPAPAQLADGRLEYLQQSVDAVALEVERIGEAQRFSDKLRAERGETSPLKKLPPEE
ncbi:MAG TPA: hypothetical protein VHE82_10930 [Gemmatimonadaceae bacterium]|nr:hypothetical protein [Gemmatimonadaceae bacterium]